MSKDNLNALTAFGFTELEADTYTVLLKNEPMTGYKIAQELVKPVANIYKAIESLHTKGAVMVDDGDNRVCRAVPVDELLRQIEVRFREDQKRALLTLSITQVPRNDDRVYQLQSYEQTLERARRMLREAREVVLLDAFPGPLLALRDDITAATRRGVEVALKAYAPAEAPGATVCVLANGRAVTERWPGEWIILVVDGREYLVALLRTDRRGVHQAVWTGSPYLSWVYHGALYSEIVMAGIENALESGADAQQLKQLLKSYRKFHVPNAPGYRALMKRFGKVEEVSSRARRGARTPKAKEKKNART